VPAEIVERIYAAALDPAEWSGVAAALETRFRGAASIFEQEAGSPSIGAVAQSGFDDDAVESYRAHFYRVNPLIPRARGLAPGAIGAHSDLMPTEALERSEYGADWMRPQRLLHGLGALFRPEGGVMTAICLMRPPAAGDYDAAERRAFAEIVPHLDRACRIVRRAGAGAIAAAAGRQALERLGMAAVLFDRRGRVLDANPAGEALLGRRAPDRSLAAGPGFEALQRALRTVADTRQSRPVTLPLGPGGSPAEASLLPVSAPLAFGMAQGAALLLVRHAPEAAPALAGLGAAFGLTPAELRLLEALAAGETLAGYGSRVGISRNTAKSQLSALFQKTGTSRQAELVRFALVRALPRN
jgi:DNA-binding CsgD family transcriptional regulator/PAS domain-containing protein